MSDDLDERIARLEALVESQQETIERLRERMDDAEDPTTTDGEPARESSTDDPAVDDGGSPVTAASSTYKVLGETDASGGAGVLGKNTAGSGTPVGVEGAVPNADGYGLSTPHDASVGGTAELAALGGGLTGNANVTTLAGDGLSISSGSLAISNASLSRYGAPTGVIAEKSGSLTDAGGLDITVPAGSGYVADASTGTTKSVDWNETTVALTANAANAVLVDNAGVPTAAVGVDGRSPTTILLGEAVTDGSGIAFVKQTPQVVDHNPTRLDTALRLGLGAVVESGLLVSPNASNPRQLDVTAGRYVYGIHVYTPAGGTSVNLLPVFGGSTFVSQTSEVDCNRYDDGSGTLATIPFGEFARHALYVVGDGTDEQYVLVYGQETFSTLAAAREGGLPPRPPLLSKNDALIASLIVENDGSVDGSLVETVDERNVM